jgi:hypothetical protein
LGHNGDGLPVGALKPNDAIKPITFCVGHSNITSL